MAEQKQTLLLFPLQMELDHFIQHCEKIGLHFNKQQIQGKHFLKCNERSWVLARCGMGKSQAGIQSQFFIDNLSGIDRILLLGGAGALLPSLKINDCIMVNKIVEHDFPNTPSFVVNELTELNKLPVGAIASGDENITTRQRADQLREQTNAIAVTWESAGVARAAKFNGIAFCELRTITDHCAGEVQKDFKKNISKGMQELATLLTSLSL